MKKINFLWVGATVIALAMTGCAKEVELTSPTFTKTGDVDITVSVKPAYAKTRALLGKDNAETIAAYEENITEFVVYIFDGNGGFLEKASTSPGAKRVIFQGYEAGDKIYAIAAANGNTAGVTLPNPSVGDKYDEVFDNMTVTLVSQMVNDFSDRSKGFLMTGMYGADKATGNISDPADTIYEVTEGDNRIEIPVERVVAKIMLGDIAFDGDVTVADIVNFEIEAAGIQKAVGNSYIYPGEITTYPVAPTYYGAFAGGSSTVASFASNLSDIGEDGKGLIDLTNLVTGLLQALVDNLDDITQLPDFLLGPVQELLTPVIGSVDALLDGTLVGLDLVLGQLDIPISKILPFVNLQDLIATPNNFWYVLPNGNTNSTMLTLKGTYDGHQYFYPVAVNPSTGIKRNTRYVINLTFLSLIGTNSPDSGTKGTNLIASVSTVEWEGDVEQDSTW